MAHVRIGSSSESLALRLEPGANYLTAELRSAGFMAVRHVWRHYVSGFVDLVTFFQRLEGDWRGWEGERVWQSLEGELEIAATHVHSQVELWVTLTTSDLDLGHGAGKPPPPSRSSLANNARQRCMISSASSISLEEPLLMTDGLWGGTLDELALDVRNATATFRIRTMEGGVQPSTNWH